MTMHVAGIPFNDVLRFPFRDSRSANRFLLLAGLTLAGFIIPVLPGIFVSGYIVRMLRKVIRDGAVEMPDFDDANRLLLDGVYSFLITMAYILPGLVTMIAAYFLYIASFFLALPMSDSNETLSFTAVLLPMAVLFFGMALGIVLLLLGAIPYPVALCRFADEGRIGAAFQLREIFGALKKNWIGYLGAWVVCMGFSSVCYFIFFITYLTVCLCCFGYLAMIVGAVAASLVFLAMVGLAYRESKTAAAAG